MKTKSLKIYTEYVCMWIKNLSKRTWVNILDVCKWGKPQRAISGLLRSVHTGMIESFIWSKKIISFCRSPTEHFKQGVHRRWHHIPCMRNFNQCRQPLISPVTCSPTARRAVGMIRWCNYRGDRNSVRPLHCVSSQSGPRMSPVY